MREKNLCKNGFVKYTSTSNLSVYKSSLKNFWEPNALDPGPTLPLRKTPGSNQFDLTGKVQTRSTGLSGVWGVGFYLKVVHRAVDIELWMALVSLCTRMVWQTFVYSSQSSMQEVRLGVRQEWLHAVVFMVHGSIDLFWTSTPEHLKDPCQFLKTWHWVQMLGDCSGGHALYPSPRL